MKKSFFVMLSFVLVWLWNVQCKKENPAAPMTDTYIQTTKGWYTGTISSNILASVPTGIYLYQSNDTVKGSFCTLNKTKGTVFGIAHETSVLCTLKQTTKNCLGTFIGTMQPATNSFALRFSGTDCNGEHQNGTGNMDLQSENIESYVKATAHQSDPQFSFFKESGTKTTETTITGRDNFGRPNGYIIKTTFSSTGNIYVMDCWIGYRDFDGTISYFSASVIAKVAGRILAGTVLGS